MSEIQGPEVDRFYESLPVKLEDSPWRTDVDTLDGWKVSSIKLNMNIYTHIRCVFSCKSPDISFPEVSQEGINYN